MSDVLADLKDLRDRARRLVFDYGNAVAQFKRDAAVESVLVAKGADWLGEKLNLPPRETRKAAAALRRQWKQSQPYRQFQAEVVQLVDRAKPLLRQAYARPPSLAEVNRVVMPDTKAQHLEGVLTTAIDDIDAWVAAGRSLPLRRVSRPRAARPRSRVRQQRRERSRWMEWLGAVGGAASIVGILLTISFLYFEVSVTLVATVGGLIFLSVISVLVFLAVRSRTH